MHFGILRSMTKDSGPDPGFEAFEIRFFKVQRLWAFKWAHTLRKDFSRPRYGNHLSCEICETCSVSPSCRALSSFLGFLKHSLPVHLARSWYTIYYT